MKINEKLVVVFSYHLVQPRSSSSKKMALVTPRRTRPCPTTRTNRKRRITTCSTSGASSRCAGAGTTCTMRTKPVFRLYEGKTRRRVKSTLFPIVGTHFFIGSRKGSSDIVWLVHVGQFHHWFFRVRDCQLWVSSHGCPRRSRPGSARN